MSEPISGPKVAVLIASSGRYELLEHRALKSVRAQTHPPDIIILVIDAEYDQQTDSELKQLIYKELDNELARANIDRKYAEKFLAILAPIKIVRMKKAEKDFKRMVLEQWRDNHK